MIKAANMTTPTANATPCPNCGEPVNFQDILRGESFQCACGITFDSNEAGLESVRADLEKFEQQFKDLKDKGRQ